jgi:hypothetical protein
MTLLAAVKKGDPTAIAKAVKAGEEVDSDVLYAALDKPDAVLAKLLELEAIDFDAEENPLHLIGYQVRASYPNDVRLKRASDPSLADPPKILDLRRKAHLLIAAGAKLDWEGAVRLGLHDEVEQMLAKNPKLAKQRIADEPAATHAAYSGAWELGKLIKEVAKSGTAFDAGAARDAIAAWAQKAVAALAKKHGTVKFRRLAFDFDSEGTLLLAADSGAAKVPGSYSHPQFAELTGAILDELCERGPRALAVLVAAARLVETTALTRTKDFAVLVFDHDDDEAIAMKRMS